MQTVALLAAPVALLALLTFAGFGAAAILGSRFPPDAQAALAPLLGLAILAASSVLLAVGVPAVPLGLTALVAPSLLTIAVRRRVYVGLRSGARPLAVALVAVVLAGAPSLAHGDWTAKAYLGNTDGYFWVSQARAFYDRPPPSPSSTFPDRLAYDRVSEQHWALTLPFLTGEVAWLSRSDPADVYGVVAAFVACLVPLAAFFCARACLEWGPGRALAAGAALAANASLLFASFFSWQQQLLGTSLAFAALTALRMAFDPPGSRRLEVLAALLAAAALASYRMAFAPYVAGMIVVVLASYLASHNSVARRHAIRSTLRFAAVFVALALGSVLALVLGLQKFLSFGIATSFKNAFPAGQFPEALGFAPNLFGAGLVWGWVATAAAAPLFILPLVRLRQSGAPRFDFLFGSTLVLLGTYALLLKISAFPPYTSFKLLGYGAPFLTLVVFSAGWLTKPARKRTVAVASIVVLVAASCFVAVAAGARHSKSAGDLAGLADVAPQLGGHVVSVQLADPWDQAWATYYLRDVPLSVERPSFVLVAVGMRRSPRIYHHPGAYYVLAAGSGGAIWERDGVALSRKPAALLADGGLRRRGFRDPSGNSFRMAAGR